MSRANCWLLEGFSLKHTPRTFLSSSFQDDADQSNRGARLQETNSPRRANIREEIIVALEPYATLLLMEPSRLFYPPFQDFAGSKRQFTKVHIILLQTSRISEPSP
jgi:hypothetical protein